MKVFLRYKYIPEDCGEIWDTTWVTVKECKDSDVYQERLMESLLIKKFSNNNEGELIQFYVLR